MNKEYLRRKMKNKKIHPTKRFLEKSHIRRIEPDYVKELLNSLENLVVINLQEEKKEVGKMVKKVNISYDYKNDILYLFTGEKVKDSLQIDNFVIDFSHNGKIVGIEIFEANKVLSGVSEFRISKKMLKDYLKEAYMKVYVGKELAVIGIGLLFKVKIRRSSYFGF